MSNVARRTGLFVLSVVSLATSLSVLQLSACSSQDPGAINYSPRQGPPGLNEGTSGATDSGSNPQPMPSDDSGAQSTPDAGNSTSTDAQASDVTDAPTGPSVLSFTLLDTSITGIVQGSPVTGQDPIKSGSTISLAQVGTALSVRANLNVTTIGSVGFVYDATNHTENATPYVLCGDDGAGTITNCNLQAGTHTITATPYELANLGGKAGNPLTITFTLAQ